MNGLPSPMLRVEKLTRRYRSSLGWWGSRQRVVRAVEEVSFVINRGETIGIVGESGCGKSTLGRTILRLDRPDSGRIVFDGQDIAGWGEGQLRPLRRRMQMVFQDPFSSLNPRQRVSSLLAEPLLLHGMGNAEERRNRVDAILSQVGLPQEAGRRHPHEFSGGQRQRIGIARALISQPDLLVCDEPVSALDVSIRAQILNLLRDLQQERGLTCMFIAHDLAAVAHMSDRVAVMYLGRIVEMASASSLVNRPLHPYTQALLASVPVPDPAARGQPPPLGGDPPSPATILPRGSTSFPPGCGFAGRCPKVMEVCRRETPALLSVSGDQQVACFLYPSPVAAGKVNARQGEGEGSSQAADHLQGLR